MQGLGFALSLSLSLWLVPDGAPANIWPAVVRGSSRFESLVLSLRSRDKVTCECNAEDINDDDDDVEGLPDGAPTNICPAVVRERDGHLLRVWGLGFGVWGLGFRV